MKKNIEILENGNVKVNGENANYDNLLAEIDPIGEYKIEDDTLVLFPFENGFIELLLKGSFLGGVSANFTTLSFDEIMDHYKVEK